MLFEVATDKATVEYSAIDAGYLRKILIEEGKEAVVNQPVAIFTEKKEESIEGYVPEGITPQAVSVGAAKTAEAGTASAPFRAQPLPPTFGDQSRWRCHATARFCARSPFATL